MLIKVINGHRKRPRVCSLWGPFPGGLHFLLLRLLFCYYYQCRATSTSRIWITSHWHVSIPLVSNFSYLLLVYKTWSLVLSLWSHSPVTVSYLLAYCPLNDLKVPWHFVGSLAHTVLVAISTVPLRTFSCMTCSICLLEASRIVYTQHQLKIRSPRYHPTPQHTFGLGPRQNVE